MGNCKCASKKDAISPTKIRASQIHRNLKQTKGEFSLPASTVKDISQINISEKTGSNCLSQDYRKLMGQKNLSAILLPSYSYKQADKSRGDHSKVTETSPKDSTLQSSNLPKSYENNQRDNQVSYITVVGGIMYEVPHLFSIDRSSLIQRRIRRSKTESGGDSNPFKKIDIESDIKKGCQLPSKIIEDRQNSENGKNLTVSNCRSIQKKTDLESEESQFTKNDMNKVLKSNINSCNMLKKENLSEEGVECLENEIGQKIENRCMSLRISLKNRPKQLRTIPVSNSLTVQTVIEGYQQSAQKKPNEIVSPSFQ